jgi:hypothetical protein
VEVRGGPCGLTLDLIDPVDGVDDGMAAAARLRGVLQPLKGLQDDVKGGAS